MSETTALQARHIRMVWAILLLAALAVPSIATAADWPMWRGDAGRTAVTSDELPDELHLQWVRHLRPQDTAWTDEEVMRFDRSYQPIVLDRLLLVASTTNDRVTAYDLESGTERWRFYCGGPIRVAPAAWKDRVFVACDDGYLYYLSTDGELRWKFLGGPRDRRLLGNGRLIGTWPARGGPVVADGKVYCTAGIWPFMGTFVYCLDADSGKVVWANDATSFTFRRLPHYGSVAFSGLSPQGHLALVGDKLLVPGSRLNLAIFDRATGEFLGYAEGTGPTVVGRDRFAVAGGNIFEVDTGHAAQLKGIGRAGRAVMAADFWYASDGIHDARGIQARPKTVAVPHGNPGMNLTVVEGSIKRVASLRTTPWLLAGSKLVVARGGELQLLDVGKDIAKPEVVWETEIEGTVSDALAAGGKLIVVTVEGTIHCFGGQETEAKIHEIAEPTRPPRNSWETKAKEILKAAGNTDGYCLVWGLKDGGLVEALVGQSRLHVVAVDTDPRKVDALRRRLDAAGWYGSRAAAIVGDPVEIEFAPYFASLITSEDPRAAGLDKGPAAVARLFDTLRPYGGTACLPLSSSDRQRLPEWAEGAYLQGHEIRSAGELTVLGRNGPLPGSAPWLGQNADAANTRCSRDTLVEAPLGVLWFGNALSNSLVLPRHGEGPVEQVVGGRLFIEGPDSLSSTDVYTGRLLWTREFPGLGRLYNSIKHQPGAHSIGSNFFAVADAVYVAADKTCHVLDPATGRTRKELRLPDGSPWQFLLVYEDLLIAGTQPVIDTEQPHERMYSPTSSRGLVAMDRRSGKILWSRKADQSFRHYGICAGAGKVFCIDRASVEEFVKAERRGQTPKETPRIYALDARSGKVVWQTEQHVAGQLSYSEAHDILVSDAAFRGATGELLWYNAERADYLWFGKWGMMIRGDRIFPQVRRSFNLLSGEQIMWTDPFGQQREWKYLRSHGCGPMAGSEHLITFRSACAGFLDLKRDGGTGNWGGFRSGCTANLIAADGVLNAPDYTRTCGCAYQNRSSLALVHMPDVEYWTYSAPPAPGRIGYNFGAPGDRRADDGTLWVAVPNLPDRMARDKSLWWGNEAAVDQDYVPRILPEISPDEPPTFYHHSSRFPTDDHRGWIAASGITGVRAVSIPLAGIDTNQPINLRLYFSETEQPQPSRRVFSVAVDGKEVLRDLDIVREAGGPWRTLLKEFPDLSYSGRKAGKLPTIELSLKPRAGEAVICGVEVIGQ